MTTEIKPKKNKGVRILVAGVALSALGLGTWYLISRNKSKSKTSGGEFPEAGFSTPDSGSKPAAGNAANNSYRETPASDFPLKKGSKGEKVKQLQKLLIEQFGAGILPKYGADGFFGNELLVALQSKSISVPVTEADFTTLSKVDPKTVATDLKKHITANDFNSTISTLKKIRNTTEYTDVGKQFRALRYGGVETSIPTALLRKFTTTIQQSQIDTILTTNIGLTKSGDKYSIPSGTAGFGRLRDGRIITTRPTRVWARARHPLSVGKETILGREVSSSNGITEFETIDGYRLFVITDHIRQY